MVITWSNNSAPWCHALRAERAHAPALLEGHVVDKEDAGWVNPRGE